MNNRLWWHKTRTTSRSRRLHIRQMMCLRMSFWRPCKARVTKTPPYQDARRRLSEKFRNRGFWPTSQFSSSSKGKGYGHGAKSSSKGKGGGFPDRPPVLTAGTDHVHQLQSLWKARSLEGRMSIQEHSSSRCWNILHQYNIGEHADYHSDRG